MLPAEAAFTAPAQHSLFAYKSLKISLLMYVCWYQFNLGHIVIMVLQLMYVDRLVQKPAIFPPPDLHR